MTSPSEEYRLIPLTQGQFAKVDPPDYGWLSQLQWFAGGDKRYGLYAQCWQYLPDGRRLNVLMHRLIMGLKSGDPLEVDHRSPGETLDNRRSNLRIVAHQINSLNRRIRRDNTSGFKGVSFNKQRQLWQAYISLDYKRVHLGFFDKAVDAGEAYKVAAISLHGDFRYTGNEQIAEYVNGQPVQGEQQ